jgi:type VI secretion system protein ImpA
MSAELNINISELLKPIPGECPSGNYLRYTDMYDQIKFSITEENPKLLQGVWQRPLKKADWEKTKTLCISALTEKTKDIQICNWLLDSLIHLYGFVGLNIGLKVIYEISKEFWDTIHPLPLEDDAETRFAPYYWLEEKFYIQVRLLKFTNPHSESEAFSLDKWEKETKPSEDSFNEVFEKFKTQISISGEEYFVEIENNISESLSTIKELKEFLLEKNSIAPHFIQLASVIDNIKSIIDIALNEIHLTKKIITTIEEEGSEKEKDSAGSVPPVSPGSGGEILTMENVYVILNRIAEFLLKNEPQNITGYMVKNALQLRSVLIKDIIKRNTRDPNTYSKVIEILGI